MSKDTDRLSRTTGSWIWSLRTFGAITCPPDGMVISDHRRDGDARTPHLRADAVAARADAHHRARILRDAATKFPRHTDAECRQSLALRAAAARQEAIGNGETLPPDRPRKGLQTIG